MSSVYSPPAQYLYIGKLLGANLNSTADQAIPIVGVGSYVLQRIVVTNASTTPLSAVGGIYAAASKSTAVVANSQVYSSLVTASTVLLVTLNSTATTAIRTESTLYFSLTTPNGSAVTADIYVYASIIS